MLSAPRRQGQDVSDSCLRATDRPEPLLGIEVRPFGGPDFARAHGGVKDERNHVLQGRPSGRGDDAPKLVVRKDSVPRLLRADLHADTGGGRHELLVLDGPVEETAKGRERSIGLHGVLGRMCSMRERTSARLTAVGETVPSAG
jgi:hypothetical protein